jgi:hypothetical protein
MLAELLVRGGDKMKLKVLGAIAAAAVIGGALTIAAPRSAVAKPEFAAQTGKPCASCHKNPAGGGELTGVGEKFKKTLKK